MHKEKLAQLGTLSNDELPVVQSLLLIGAIEIEQEDIQAYETLLLAMHDAVTVLNPKDDLQLRAGALQKVIHAEFGFRGDTEEYDRVDHMNFLKVLDRRKGIPVALGALYLHLAQQQGWSAVGLNFPGHFLVRMDIGAQRLIIDPYHGVIDLKASDMRHLLKRVLGDKAELDHHYYDAVTARDVVLRFCNNRKSRLIQSEYYQQALNLIKLEIIVAPNEPRLLFDAGMIAMRLDLIHESLSYMDQFIQHSTDTKTINEAKEIQRHLRQIIQ